MCGLPLVKNLVMFGALGTTSDYNFYMGAQNGLRLEIICSRRIFDFHFQLRDMDRSSSQPQVCN